MAAEWSDAARQVRVRVAEEMTAACATQWGQDVEAVVLTGSLARGEATIGRHGDHWEVLGDVECVVVLRRAVRLPSASVHAALQETVENGLKARGVRSHVSMAVVHAAYLERLEPSVFAYELRECGQVLSGDGSVLTLVPEFRAGDIPREDAWRLLCNRLIEYLETLVSGERGHEGQYRVIKLYLDMATSFLVFAQAYAPTYQARARRLNELAVRSSPPVDVPLPLEAFAARVDECTRLKLGNPDRHDMVARAGSERLGICWPDTLAWARGLWRWELARLVEASNDLSDDVLIARLMRRQPARQRIRGWVHVMREQGWTRSWRQWGRWLRLGIQGSPRYHVYAAANEVLAESLGMPGGSNGAGRRDPVRSLDRLPMTWSGGGGWREVAGDVVRNYHRFLETTRA